MDQFVDISIGRMKNSGTLYSHDGIMYTLKELYDTHKKRPGKSKYLLSAVVRIHNNNGDSMMSRIVFVRDRANKKKWIAFLCTDMNLSEEQIIELYGKRWSIEEFFCGHTMLDEKAVIKLMDEFFQTLPARIKCFAKLQNAS